MVERSIAGFDFRRIVHIETEPEEVARNRHAQRFAHAWEALQRARDGHNDPQKSGESLSQKRSIWSAEVMRRGSEKIRGARTLTIFDRKINLPPKNYSHDS